MCGGGRSGQRGDEGGLHGGSDGPDIPGGVAPLHHPGPAGGVQPGHKDPSSGGHGARVHGQKQHRVQSCYLYLSQQSGAVTFA